VQAELSPVHSGDRVEFNRVDFVENLSTVSLWPRTHCRQSRLSTFGNKVDQVSDNVDGDKLPNSSCCQFVAKTSNRVDCNGNKQGDHLSGKPGNVREFDSCQGNVSDFTENQGNVREKILSGKSCLKLFIVSCIFVSMYRYLVGVYSVLSIKYMVSDHVLLHSYPHH